MYNMTHKERENNMSNTKDTVQVYFPDFFARDTRNQGATNYITSQLYSRACTECERYGITKPAGDIYDFMMEKVDYVKSYKRLIEYFLFKYFECLFGDNLRSENCQFVKYIHHVNGNMFLVEMPSDVYKEFLDLADDRRYYESTDGNIFAFLASDDDINNCLGFIKQNMYHIVECDYYKEMEQYRGVLK